MMQIELARLLDVGKVSLGILLDRLEESGLVERKPDQFDRRTKRVIVSDKGIALTQEMNVLAMEMNAQIMRGIPASKQLVLEKMLATMKHNLIEMDAAPPPTKGGGIARRKK